MSPDDAPPIHEFRRWQQHSVAASRFSCRPIKFSDSREWQFADGQLRRRSGGFFSLAGILGSARESRLDGHQQLIILQPQIAINGFLLRQQGGSVALLFHGRLEPGNVGGMQLAPTVQSTESNYKRVHGGRSTPFIDHFLRPSPEKILFDGLQSEEATRYFGKYNRNVVLGVRDDAELEIPSDFRWATIDDLRHFVRAHNVLNTDARSVLACVDWDLLAGQCAPFSNQPAGSFGNALHKSYSARLDQWESSNTNVFAWLSHLRAQLGLRTRIIALDELENWVRDDFVIRERDVHLGFVARQFEVYAYGREVDHWDQPLIDSSGCGRLSLVCQERHGVLHILVKASSEIGFLEGVQLAPSICVAPGEKVTSRDPVEQTLLSLIGDSAKSLVLYRCRQSEEGGRFYQDENDYELVLIDPGVSLPPSNLYRWLTLAQIRDLIRVSGVFSMEFRGALTLLLAYI